jgi:hypothetical protein
VEVTETLVKEALATEVQAISQCTRQLVATVEVLAKFLSSQVMTGLFIAVTALKKVAIPAHAEQMTVVVTEVEVLAETGIPALAEIQDLKCTRQHAPIAVSLVKFLLDQVAISQFSAIIALKKVAMPAATTKVLINIKNSLIS